MWFKFGTFCLNWCYRVYPMFPAIAFADKTLKLWRILFQFEFSILCNETISYTFKAIKVFKCSAMQSVSIAKHAWLTVILNFRWWKTFRSWRISGNSDRNRDQTVDVIWRLTIPLKNVQVSSVCVETNSKEGWSKKNCFLLFLWCSIHKYLGFLQGKQLQIYADRQFALIHKVCNSW